MNLDSNLISQLREGLLQGRRLPELVALLRAGPNAGMNSHVVMNYFMRAFDLPFTQVRHLPGAACLGGQAYTDDEIEAKLRAQIDLPHVGQLLQLSRALSPAATASAL